MTWLWLYTQQWCRGPDSHRWESGQWVALYQGSWWALFPAHWEPGYEASLWDYKCKHALFPIFQKVNWGLFADCTRYLYTINSLHNFNSTCIWTNRITVWWCNAKKRGAPPLCTCVVCNNHNKNIPAGVPLFPATGGPPPACSRPRLESPWRTWTAPPSPSIVPVSENIGKEAPSRPPPV